MMILDRPTIGMMFSETFAITRRNIIALVVYTVFVSVFSVVSTLAGEKWLETIAEFLASFIGGYFLAVVVIRKEGLGDHGVAIGTLLASLGLAIVAGLGVFVGFLLLVVPGLVLLARWSIASSLVVGRGEPVFESLGKSWDATAEVQWRIVGLYVIAAVATLAVAVPFGAVLGYSAILGDDLKNGQTVTFISIVVAVASNGLSAVYACLPVALLGLLMPHNDPIEDVFG